VTDERETPCFVCLEFIIASCLVAPNLSMSWPACAIASGLCRLSQGRGREGKRKPKEKKNLEASNPGECVM
jgi:hypothetical protein